MKTKAKIIIAAVLAIAISIGSISVYKYINRSERREHSA